MKKRLVLGVLFLFVFSVNSFCASKEEIGQAAEQTGKNREALTQYVTALQSATEGSADDQRLREKIIMVVQKLNPPPAISEEAERYMGRGTAAFKVAEGPEDLKLAAEEFKKALDLVPWWTEAYFNLGLVKEQEKEYEKAIFNLKLYLLAVPQGPDAKNVKQKIYEMEFLADREKTKRSEAHGQKAKLQSLAGTWNLEKQMARANTNWRGTFTMTMKDETTIEGYVVSDQRPQVVLRGTLKGQDIQWEALVRATPACESWAGFKQVTLSISTDQRSLSYQAPDVWLDDYSTGCREHLEDYVLTRS